MRTLRVYFLVGLCLFCLSARAQWKWLNPLQTNGPVIQNQGWIDETGSAYTRLPERAKAQVRTAVWDLSRHTAGLALYFYSNAPQIAVRYQVDGSQSMPHMPATGVSGVDLYRIDTDGGWQFCFGGYHFSDTIRYDYSLESKNPYHNHGYEYRLYLPLYNHVKWLEIGIPEGSECTFLPASTEKPIVLYGTSIAQGACASRPGMAWSTVLQRSLDYPLINLGFSGNGKLEKEVLSLVSEIEARLYILDCLPNLTGESEETIFLRTVDAVKQIRHTRTTPILLCEHAGYSNAATHLRMDSLYSKANRASRKAYEQLLTEGVKELYYLSCKEISIPADGWVDYVHPSDLGAQAQASAVEKKVREILCIPIGDTSTAYPATQRREPDMYEWQTRHREQLNRNRENPPCAVLLGNSITHYWGGEPTAPRQNGLQSWEAIMTPAGFWNLGCGWDRIENVLWRVYHGELEGYKAEKVALMIGTNNLDSHTDEEIAEGIRFLLSAIRTHQPEATIQLIGILPRRGKEKRIKGLNRLLGEIAHEADARYADVSPLLIQTDGTIQERWFSDGLHPNEEGYRRIAEKIAE